MFVTRVFEHNLGKRLDAEFYDPQYISNEDKLKKSHLPVEKLLQLSLKLRCGPFDSALHSSSYVSEGVPFVHPTSFSSGVFEIDKVERISLADHDRLIGTKFNTPALVFTRVGTPCCGLIPSGLGSFNIHGDVIGVECNHELDTYFTYAFFQSNTGFKELLRYQAGSTRPRTNTDDLSFILVVKPSTTIQSYVGNKVRQAERLREWANVYKHNAQMLIEDFSAFFIPPNVHSKPRRIKSKLLSPDSLGPHFTWAIEGHTYISNGVPISQLIDNCYCGEPIRSDHRIAGNYPYYGASGPIDSHCEFNFEGEFIIAEQDGSIGIISVARGRFWANNHVWVLSIKSEFDPDAIAEYLNTYYPYWVGMTTGSVIPKVTSENLLKIFIPFPIATAKNTIGRKLRQASRAFAMAKLLVKAAKLLIEALIEGHLTESELEVAQQALENGDNSLDKAILARLTAKGIDIEGEPPLFPDLDALYQLLAEAEAATDKDTVAENTDEQVYAAS